MMNNILDSRRLGPGNCYGRAFNDPGTYQYALVAAFGAPFAREFPFAVAVAGAEQRAEPRQLNVAVSFRNGHLEASPATLSISAGDFVLWHADGSDVPHFAVVGERATFASDRLVAENVFTHVFGLPGEFEFADANGSALAGTVIVSAPDPEDEPALRRWNQQSTQPTLVMIERGKPKPSKLQLVVNQQVFFAVADGRGITITDKRLLQGPREERQESAPSASRA